MSLRFNSSFLKKDGIGDGGGKRGGESSGKRGRKYRIRSKKKTSKSGANG